MSEIDNKMITTAVTVIIAVCLVGLVLMPIISDIQGGGSSDSYTNIGDLYYSKYDGENLPTSTISFDISKNSTEIGVDQVTTFSIIINGTTVHTETYDAKQIWDDALEHGEISPGSSTYIYGDVIPIISVLINSEEYLPFPCHTVLGCAPTIEQYQSSGDNLYYQCDIFWFGAEMIELQDPDSSFDTYIDAEDNVTISPGSITIHAGSATAEYVDGEIMHISDVDVITQTGEYVWAETPIVEQDSEIMTWGRYFAEESLGWEQYDWVISDKLDGTGEQESYAFGIINDEGGLVDTTTSYSISNEPYHSFYRLNGLTITAESDNETYPYTISKLIVPVQIGEPASGDSNIAYTILSLFPVLILLAVMIMISKPYLLEKIQ